MAKNKKEKTSRVITISKQDNWLFKEYVIELEKTGCTKNPSEIASDCFAFGLYESSKLLRYANEKNE
jgi:hypothetical protein